MNIRLSGNQIKKLTEEKLKYYLPELQLYNAAFSNMTILHCLIQQINTIEKSLHFEVKKNLIYKLLLDINGIGNEAMTIAKQLRNEGI